MSSNKHIEGFLLAAGLGTRMGPLSKILPKPAWTLLKKPLLQWGADSLREAGITRITCNAHHLPDKIREAAGDSLEVCLEPVLLGSAGGLRHVLGRAADPLMVWNGDAFAHVPWQPFIAEHKARKAELSWLLVPHVGGPYNPVWLDDYGRIAHIGNFACERSEQAVPNECCPGGHRELRSQAVAPELAEREGFARPSRGGPGGHRELRSQAVPPELYGPFHFTGAALWSRSALALLPEGPSDVKTDILPLLKHHAGIVVDPFLWYDIGSPDQLIATARIIAPTEEGRIPGCYIHPSAVPDGVLTRCVLGPGARPAPSLKDENALWFLEGTHQVRLWLD